MLNVYSYYNILIVGDSRTQFLQNFLNQTSLNIRYHVITIPGATLQRIADVAIQTLDNPHYYHLTNHAGGINNITMLRHRPTRHAVLRYRRADVIIENVIREMRICVEAVQEHTYMPVAIASLSGMHLNHYSPTYQFATHYMQRTLDFAITRINLRIRGINRLNSLYTPDLSSAVHRCAGRGGTYRSHYSHLPDGLYPGAHLLRVWTNNLHAYCFRLFPEATHLQDLVPDYYYR